MITPIRHFEGFNITINVTEDCNLRCSYCYETCKTKRSVSLSDCKKFINRILDEDFPKTSLTGLLNSSVVFDFIGGDALMRVDLLEEIFRFITTKMALLEDRFPRGYMFNVTSNGTLFENPDVRSFCERWKNVLSVGVSIDGCPAIHDLNRVYPSGKGSMESILKSWSWYQKTFPSNANSTKSTCNRDSIPYLYESLKFMHETLGLKYIYQNFIMEDMHLTEEDLDLLEEQFNRCLEYVLDHRHDLYWSMIEQDDLVDGSHTFDPEVTRCGSGWMPTLSVDGCVYPCFRWLAPSQNGQNGVMSAGHINGVLNFDRFLEVQENSKKGTCSDEECKACEWESFCAYCIAGCYAETGTFKRLKHICEITKMKGRMSREYWRRYHELENR